MKSEGFTYLIVLLLLILRHDALLAQQSGFSSQYLFNIYDVNAAYAGNHRQPSFALRYRNQWMGMPGAPITTALSFHTPMLNERGGWGLRVVHETIGLRTQMMAKASMAFKIPLFKGKLALAISGGVLRQQFNSSKISAQDQGDQLIQNANWNVTLPIFDASILYSDNRSFFGIQSERINKARYYPDRNSLARLYAQLSSTGGYFFRMNKNDLLLISYLMRYSEGKIVQAEMNASYLWHNKIWLGAGYRSSYGALFMCAFNANKALRIGYSYDLPLNATASNYNGSHELFIGYHLSTHRYPSIRYF
jgi:type IX secretion system PorP/SprF family membrane protein